jgi:ABC-type transport system substrate-binding protein
MIKKIQVGILTSILILSAMSILLIPATAQDEYFFKIHLSVSGDRVDVAEFLQPYFNEIGIEVEIHPYDWSVLDELIHQDEKLTFEEGGWDMSIEALESRGDPSAGFDSILLPGNPNNVVGYNNPRVTELLDQGREETDQAVRKQIFLEVQEIIRDELPYIFGYQDVNLKAFKEGLEGVDDYVAWRGQVSDSIWADKFIFDPNPAQEDTLVHAFNWDSPYLIPLVGWSYLRGSHETLTILNPDFSIGPQLAESWDISDEGKTYTFYFQPDAMWHDGVPFTSTDVKFTFDTILADDSPSYMRGAFAWIIESIEIINDKTVAFHLSTPSAGFLDQLSWNAAVEIVPEHVLGDIPPGDWAQSELNTITGIPGTGPWKFVEREPEVFITYERNDDYWDPAEMPKMKYLSSSSRAGNSLGRVAKRRNH